MNKNDFNEFIQFAKEQDLMNERIELAYSNFLVLRKSWIAGLIIGK